jgi:hypothetical protein
MLAQRLCSSARLHVLGLLLLVLSTTSCQKNEAELAQLRQEHQELEQLRAKVEETKDYVPPTEVARLRKENEEVHRLRNEIRQARDEVKQAQAQLKTASGNPQVASENNKLKSELEQLRQSSAAQNAQNALNTCLNNMRQIAGAAQQWAVQRQKPNGTPLSPADLMEAAKILPGGRVPVCPAGGAYGVVVVGANPQCSVPGHVLTQ